MRLMYCLFFFFNDTATTEIYTLSLHDALPISGFGELMRGQQLVPIIDPQLALTPAADWKIAGHSVPKLDGRDFGTERSEEHTSELQSQSNLVCRLLLEKKKNRQTTHREE